MKKVVTNTISIIIFSYNNLRYKGCVKHSPLDIQLILIKIVGIIKGDCHDKNPTITTSFRYTSSHT